MKNIIKANDCLFFLCDIQIVFRDLIYKMPSLINSNKLLLKSMQTLEIPILKTEHYPKAFGHTLPELDDILKNHQHETIEKRTFSMITEDTLKYLSFHKEKKTIILSGIEAHVCVLQTSLDLLNRNYQVVLVADAISSQREYDRKWALNRIENAGAILTTSESLIYELMQTSLHPKFKNILGFIKERNKHEFF